MSLPTEHLTLHNLLYIIYQTDNRATHKECVGNSQKGLLPSIAVLEKNTNCSISGRYVLGSHMLLLWEVSLINAFLEIPVFE